MLTAPLLPIRKRRWRRQVVDDGARSGPELPLGISDPGIARSSLDCQLGSSWTKSVENSFEYQIWQRISLNTIGTLSCMVIVSYSKLVFSCRRLILMVSLFQGGSHHPPRKISRYHLLTLFTNWPILDHREFPV